jgi:hypothetical protein
MKSPRKDPTKVGRTTPAITPNQARNCSGDLFLETPIRSRAIPDIDKLYFRRESWSEI